MQSLGAQTSARLPSPTDPRAEATKGFDTLGNSSFLQGWRDDERHRGGSFVLCL